MVRHNCFMLYYAMTLCGLIFIDDILSLNNMDLTLLNDGSILLNEVTDILILDNLVYNDFICFFIT